MKFFVCNLLLVAIIDGLLCVWAGVDGSATTKVVEDLLLKIGDRVMRGEDWQYQDEDGGPGSEGTITAFEQDGFATVKWSNGEHQMYRIGADGLYELKKAPNSRLPTTTTTDISYFDFETKELTPLEIEDVIVTSDEIDVNTTTKKENEESITDIIPDSNDSENGTLVNAAIGLKYNNTNSLVIIACLFSFILLTL